MSYYQALGLTREPFSNSPDPDLLYRARTHLECLQHMEIAVRLRRGLNVVLGEVGTGKTTLSRELVRLLAQDGDIDVHLLDDPSCASTTEFLLTLSRLFGLDMAAAGRDAALLKDAVKDWLLTRGEDGRRIVALLIDEGQKITPECLELLRELLNFETNTHKLLQIVIFAQTEFEDALLARPNLDDRVNYRYRLLPLSRLETRRMIETRLALCAPDGKAVPVFTRLALRRVHRLTGGYPRKIVRLCHLSMLLAVGFGKRRIGWGLVGRASRESQGPGRRWFRRLALAGAAGGLVALCLQFAGPALPGARLAALDALGRLQTHLSAQVFDPAPAAVATAPAVPEAPAQAEVAAAPPAETARPPEALPVVSASEEALGLDAASPAETVATPARIPAAKGTVGKLVAVASKTPQASAQSAAPPAMNAEAPAVAPAPAPAPGLGAAATLSVAAMPPDGVDQVIVVDPAYAGELQVAPAAVPAAPDQEASPALASATLPDTLGRTAVRPGWAVTRQAARIYGNGGKSVMARIAKANPGVDFNRVRAGETITFPAISAEPLPQGACLIRVASADSLDKSFAVIGRQREADPVLSLYCTQQPGLGLRFDVVLAHQFASRAEAEATLAGLPRELAAKAVLVDGFPAGTVAFTDLGLWNGRRSAPKLAAPAATRQVAVSEPATQPLP